MHRTCPHPALPGLALLLGLVCFAPPVAAGPGETRVPGAGHAATQRPASTPSPSGGFLDRADEHDPEQGERYDGIAHYELRQGNQPDDKARWRRTDFIHWTVFGATLVARGEIHDIEPDKATIASSESWGMELVEARIGADEGAEGRIRAENRIGFDYRYLISGEHIAEASVQLSGHAYDMHGGAHSLDVSDQRAESTTDETHETSGLTLTSGLDLGQGGELSLDGLTLSTSQALMLKWLLERRVEARVVRRSASAGGDSNSTTTQVFHDEVRGATPLARTWVVTSDGAVTLRARAGRGSDDDVRYPVFVQLERFQVTNELRVWTSVTAPTRSPEDPEGAPPPEDPGAPAPTSGGDDPPPPPPTGDEPTPGSGDDDPAPEPIGPGAPEGPVRRRLRGRPGLLPGMADRHGLFSMLPPFGLDGEGGSLAGSLAIGLDGPAPRDLVFVVSCQPAAALHWADGLGRVTVRGGERWGSLPVHAAAAGPIRISASLLDEQEVPRETGIVLDAELASVAAHPLPALWAAVDGRTWRPGTPVHHVVVAGQPDGVLRVGRLGFAGFDTGATRVTLSVEDPGGVLAPLPAAVEIPAGESACDVALPWTGRPGDAVLTLATPDRTLTVTLACRAQDWEAPAALRIPVGAVAPLGFVLDRVERIGRPVTILPGPAGIAVLDEEAPAPLLRPGEPAGAVPLRGLVPGHDTWTLQSPGLAPLTVAVEVVPVEIVLLPDRLVIDRIETAAEGQLLLRLPAGGVFRTLELPAELAEAVAVEGLGTRALLLTISPSAALGERIELPCIWEAGAASAGHAELTVLDTLHERPAGPWAHAYRIAAGG